MNKTARHFIISVTYLVGFTLELWMEQHPLRAIFFRLTDCAAFLVVFIEVQNNKWDTRGIALIMTGAIFLVFFLDLFMGILKCLGLADV